MSTFVMSDKYPCFVREIERLGHSVISSDTVSVFPKPEQQHADMQVLLINDSLFILNECLSLAEKLSNKNLCFCGNYAGNKYPENILLNFLFIGNTLYGKLSAIDKNLLDYCSENNIKTVNVNQGYARCATLVLNNKAAITSDVSIEKALRTNGVEVLVISQGNIALDGYNYGFIGGASGKIDRNTIVFFGNITRHPDFDLIKAFCNKHNTEIKILCNNIPVTDIGGIVNIG